MRFATITALAGMIILGLAFVAGCSDDQATAPTITYADNEDPIFVSIKTQIDETLEGVVNDMTSGLGNIKAVPGDTVSIKADLMPIDIIPDPLEEVDTLIAIYQNDWYYVYASYYGDAYRAQLKDSVQYRIDGAVVEHPSLNVDYIHCIKNWNIAGLDPAVTHVDLSGRTEIEIDGLDGTVAAIEGNGYSTNELTYVAEDTTATANFSFEYTIANVQVAMGPVGWANACPVSGTMTLGLSYVYIWSNGSGSGNGSSAWTINASFNNGTATVTATNGASTWQYTREICTIATQ